MARSLADADSMSASISAIATSRLDGEMAGRAHRRGLDRSERGALRRTTGSSRATDADRWSRRSRRGTCRRGRQAGRSRWPAATRAGQLLRDPRPNNLWIAEHSARRCSSPGRDEKRAACRAARGTGSPCLRWVGNRVKPERSTAPHIYRLFPHRLAVYESRIVLGRVVWLLMRSAITRPSGTGATDGTGRRSGDAPISRRSVVSRPRGSGERVWCGGPVIRGPGRDRAPLAQDAACRRKARYRVRQDAGEGVREAQTIEIDRCPRGVRPTPARDGPSRRRPQPRS